MRALCLLVIGACTPAVPERSAEPAEGVDGVEELSQGLADLTSQCSFASNVLALTLEPGDVGWLSVGTGGTVLVNGYTCGGATVATTNRIDVSEGGQGDQSLILDLRYGAMAAGKLAGPGLVVSLGSGTDTFKLIGSPYSERVAIGTLGLTFNADAFVDVRLTSVEAVTINLDDGPDSVTGMGDEIAGQAYTSTLLLFGGAGNDTIIGGTGADTYTGGDGDDTFLAGASADGADTMIGGLGRDVADYTARTTSLDLSKDGVANDGATGETDAIGADVEVLKGGKAADTITGGAGADTVYGGPDADTITGMGGDDVLYGEAGDDIFDEGNAANGADTIDGGAGSDTVTYVSRTSGVTIACDDSSASGAPAEGDHILDSVETAIGGSGNDTLRGGIAANRLEGRDGDDTIHGGAGNDVLLGGTGTNTLYGDAGEDRFDQGASPLGDDSISGGTGIDSVDYSARTADLAVVMDGVTASGEAGESDAIGTDVENVTGGSGNDVLTGNAGDNLLDGGAGVDTLNGLAGDDTLDGGSGADTLACGAGDADISLDTSTASVSSCEL